MKERTIPGNSSNGGKKRKVKMQAHGYHPRATVRCKVNEEGTPNKGE